ncbi:protein Star [Microplitis demolitor]|uniref:protein Star n=1 Tax=Microplitis demolitor TaxID=69319 RepID=UPI0004CD4483|nr:protein Star [Microplitis demolitor]XP_053598417.1 protein Star [Microplitis demolitor]
MAGLGAAIPSVAGTTAPLPITSISLGSTHKKSLLRRVAPCLAFLAAFSSAMALLLIWSEAAALRRQAFDANMTKDYVLRSVSMDNPQLVAYIREVQLKKATRQYNFNVTETVEEKSLVTLLQGKRNGIYLEYINRPGAVFTTSWLEAKYGWRGVLVLTDFRSFFETCKSNRNQATRILHACLSTDKDTKEITYHQESEVRVTKLGEGPNSIIFTDEGLPTMRLKCFPLYSVLLAYNHTTIDYLNLDSTDISDIQVLDTLPWDKVQINFLSIRWSEHHTDAEFEALSEKLKARKYRFLQPTDTGKLIFMYSRVKI